MTATFPYLPGLTFPVDRAAGNWDTTKEVSVSGKETRYINRTQARRKYTVDVEALDSSGVWSSLIANSLQQLEAFYNSCYGSGLIFNFWDVDDNAVIGQQFGVGDGVTTAFQLVRTLGGWTDNVYAPLNVSAATLVPSVNGGQIYPPNNMLGNSGSLAWENLVNFTEALGATDPKGGTSAGTLTETAVNNVHLFYEPGSRPAGAALTFSVYLKYGTSQYASLIICNGSPTYVGAGLVVDLINGRIVTVAQQNGNPSSIVTSITPAANGFFRVSISCAPDAAGTNWIAYVCGCSASSPQIDQSYLGAVTNTYIVAFPQVEIAVAPGLPSVFLETYATQVFGSPTIYLNGVYQIPTNYTVSSSGVVTFATPPASGAALTWTGNYYWPCNFDDDTLALSKFMSGLYEAKKLSFTTRIF